MENFVTPSTWQMLDRTPPRGRLRTAGVRPGGHGLGLPPRSAKRVAAPSAGPVQGTTVRPAARMRLATPWPPSTFPITDVVATDGGSGFRTWYPPA